MEAPEFYYLICSCPAFAQGCGSCPHTIAIAETVLHLIDFESELQATISRKKAGRPANQITGAKALDKSNGVKLYDAAWFRTDLKRKLSEGKGLAYQWWQVARDFSDTGSVKTSVGFILMFDAKPVIWTVKCPGHPSGEDLEDLGLDDISDGMAKAFELGCGGPIPAGGAGLGVVGPFFRNDNGDDDEEEPCDEPCDGDGEDESEGRA